MNWSTLHLLPLIMHCLFDVAVGSLYSYCVLSQLVIGLQTRGLKGEGRVYWYCVLLQIGWVVHRLSETCVGVTDSYSSDVQVVRVEHTTSDVAVADATA
jgi:hypothetical protein